MARTLTDRLIAKDVEVRAEARSNPASCRCSSLWLPFIVLIGVWIFFMNRMQGGGKGGAMGFGKSKRQAADRKERAV